MGRSRRAVNDTIYEELGERWYSAHDDPVALLRAEARARNPWLAERLRESVGPGARVLDLGCGGGFLSNYLAREGFRVTAVDTSASSLQIAARYDSTQSVRYELGDALRLEHPDATFDAVCAMDFLEHVEAPEQLLAQAARVLRRGGLFLFHTFDRSPLAWLIVIKGVEWFVRNTPRDLHALRLFLKPEELRRLCAAQGLVVVQMHGLRPALSFALPRLLATGVVPPDFRFVLGGPPRLGYTGYARRT